MDSKILDPSLEGYRIFQAGENLTVLKNTDLSVVIGLFKFQEYTVILHTARRLFGVYRTCLGLSWVVLSP